MNIDDMTIKDAKELARLFSGDTPDRLSGSRGERDCGVRIVILQRGWVVVGHVYEGQEVRIENAAVVRRWGTSKGLGELAKNGPLDKTVLDDGGTVRVHPLSLIAQIDCAKEAWRDRL